MSLVTQINTVLTRIGTEFKSIRTALGLKADASDTVSITGTQTISGLKTYSTIPQLSVGAGLPVVPREIDTKQYVDSKRNPVIYVVTSDTEPGIDFDAYDMISITAQAAAITSFTVNSVGTLVNGQKFMARIKSAGAYAIAWGSLFQASGSVALPTTTVAGKTVLAGFIYDSVLAKFVCVASDAVGY